MAEATAPTLSDVAQAFLSAVVVVLKQVADTIAANAKVVAELLIVGAVAFVIARYGVRIFRSIYGMFRGLLG